MKFTVKELFSVVDGRLSTKMEDVYKILNFLTKEDLFTHHLPVAMRFIKLNPPKWFSEIKDSLDKLSGSFEEIMLDPYMDVVYDIEPLEDLSGFPEFMVENSLLLKR